MRIMFVSTIALMSTFLIDSTFASQEAATVEKTEKTVTTENSATNAQDKNSGAGETSLVVSATELYSSESLNRCSKNNIIAGAWIRGSDGSFYCNFLLTKEVIDALVNNDLKAFANLLVNSKTDDLTGKALQTSIEGMVISEGFINSIKFIEYQKILQETSKVVEEGKFEQKYPKECNGLLERINKLIDSMKSKTELAAVLKIIPNGKAEVLDLHSDLNNGTELNKIMNKTKKSLDGIIKLNKEQSTALQSFVSAEDLQKVEKLKEITDKIAEVEAKVKADKERDADMLKKLDDAVKEAEEKVKSSQAVVDAATKKLNSISGSSSSAKRNRTNAQNELNSANTNLTNSQKALEDAQKAQAEANEKYGQKELDELKKEASALENDGNAAMALKMIDSQSKVMLPKITELIKNIETIEKNLNNQE